MDALKNIAGGAKSPEGRRADGDYWRGVAQHAEAVGGSMNLVWRLLAAAERAAEPVLSQAPTISFGGTQEAAGQVGTQAVLADDMLSWARDEVAGAYGRV